MQRLPRGVYTKEFREQAVRLVLEEGLPILQAGQRLSMSPKTLANWVGAARRGELAVLGGRQKPSTESEQELRRLRRELAEIKMERDRACQLFCVNAFDWTITATGPRT